MLNYQRVGVKNPVPIIHIFPNKWLIFLWAIPGFPTCAALAKISSTRAELTVLRAGASWIRCKSVERTCVAKLGTTEAETPTSSEVPKGQKFRTSVALLAKTCGQWGWDGGSFQEWESYFKVHIHDQIHDHRRIHQHPHSKKCLAILLWVGATPY